MNPIHEDLNALVSKAGTFVMQEGRLRFYSVEQAIVVCGDYRSLHKTLQLGFIRSDGGIYVQSPYFPSRHGVMAAFSRDPHGRSVSETYDFRDTGKVALDHFKLSHHANGFVHFSRSGWWRTKIERQSFRLTDQRGLICQLTLGPASAFTVALKSDRLKDRVYLPFVFTDQIPNPLTITFEWKEKETVAKLAPERPYVGPLLQIGSTARFFVGQPTGFPQQSHVVEIQCGRADPISGADGPILALLGGFDADHAAFRDPNSGTGFLALLYPIPDANAMAERIPAVQRRRE
jgi:hypothetical protein